MSRPTTRSGASAPARGGSTALDTRRPEAEARRAEAEARRAETEARQAQTEAGGLEAREPPIDAAARQDSPTPPAGGGRSAAIARAIFALAARQHGVVARRQLLRSGVPAHAIDHRVGSGWLQTLHPGVYRTGPVRGSQEREMAAVLACGEGAVLSHAGAAPHWNLLGTLPGAAPVDVSTERDVRRRGRGIRVHRVARLDPDEVTTVEGVPITTVGRTLVDLSGVLASRELERAWGRAERRGLLERPELARLLDRHLRRPGTRALRRLLDREARAAFTRSEAEVRLLAIVRRGKLRDPETNVVLHGFEVDCLWRRERVVLEIDGWETHGRPGAFETDRRRDAVLMAAGHHVMRVTWRQLVEEPEAVLVRLAQALARTG